MRGGGAIVVYIAIIALGVVEKILDFMDSCSLFLFLSTFLGGYDLYIISTEYYPLKLERATGPKGRSCELLANYSNYYV